MKNNKVTGMPPVIQNGQKRLALFAVLIGFSMTFGSAPALAGTIPAKVLFSGSCPTGVDPETIPASKSNGDKVEWTAVDATSGQPVNISYQVFFDPFVGKAISSNNNGVAKSKPIAGDVPVNVTFKYTIYSPACPDGPYDPRINVIR